MGWEASRSVRNPSQPLKEKPLKHEKMVFILTAYRAMGTVELNKGRSALRNGPCLEGARTNHDVIRLAERELYPLPRMAAAVVGRWVSLGSPGPDWVGLELRPVLAWAAPPFWKEQ